MGGGASQPTTEREELAFLGGSDDANNKDDSDHHSEGHRPSSMMALFSRAFTATKTIDWAKGDVVDRAAAEELLGDHFDADMFESLKNDADGRVSIPRKRK